MHTRRAMALGGAVLGVVLLIGGAAAADTTTKAPVGYAGCVEHETGVLYGVSTAPARPTACRKKDTAITWNETGPQGASGAPGTPGPAGPQGPKGDAGDTGAAGPQGVQGAPGAPGAAGASAYDIWKAAGNEGSEANFLASLTGPKGDAGPAGPQGPAGSAGAPGTAAGSTQLVSSSATAGGHYTTFTVCDHHNAFGQCDQEHAEPGPWNADKAVTAVASCPAGTILLNGSGTLHQFEQQQGTYLSESRLATASGDVPATAAEATSWTVTYTDPAQPLQSWSVGVQVLCMTVS